VGEGWGEGERYYSGFSMITQKTMLKRAKRLRKNSTDVERYLWSFLRNRYLNGYKFRRQKIIGHYIVDFVCEKKKIIIELDGGQHAINEKYDDKRTLFLKNKGYTVLRFWNVSVFTETYGVLETILKQLDKE